MSPGSPTNASMCLCTHIHWANSTCVVSLRLRCVTLRCVIVPVVSAECRAYRRECACAVIGLLLARRRGLRREAGRVGGGNKLVQNGGGSQQGVQLSWA